MLFTIITICFNEQKRIAKTLESIYNQTFTDYEHIIEDGLSNDNTLGIVSDYKAKNENKNIRIFSEKDNGLYDAMNRAVKRANGGYICFINSGDYLFDKYTLEKVAEQIGLYPKMDWYYGECVLVFPNGMEYMQIPTSIENTEGDDIRKDLLKRPLTLNHQTIFSKRECNLSFPFDTRYKLRAELKWYYECLLANIKVKKMEFPVCRYSLGGISERISSVRIHAEETGKMLVELGMDSEERTWQVPDADDYRDCLKYIYNEWLALKQAGYGMEQYLLNLDIHKVAIYGYGEFATHIVHELKNSQIEIVCLIDRANKYPYSGIKTVTPDNFNDEVDMIIVAALTHYDEIYTYMKQKGNYRICSLEDILENMW